jgi:hypothetical protein
MLRPGYLSRYSDYGISYTVRDSKQGGGEVFRLYSEPPTPLYRRIKRPENYADPSPYNILGQLWDNLYLYLSAGRISVEWMVGRKVIESRELLCKIVCC